jgi:hypothetical protein
MCSIPIFQKKKKAKRLMSNIDLKKCKQINTRKIAEKS